MPEEPEGELDLSNLDALLKDIEKDMPPEPASPPAAPPAAEAKPVPAAPPPVPPLAAAASLPPQVSEELSVAPAPSGLPEEPLEAEPPAEELLASPVPAALKDEGDEFEDMFTEEEEAQPPVVMEPKSVDEEMEVPPPPSAVKLPAAPVVAEALPVSFEDALELEEAAVPTPLPMPVLPTPKPPPLPPSVSPPTLEDFKRALKNKDYPRAVEIGEALNSPKASLVFRQNFAGALFYAGRREAAEKELSAILEQFPYAVSARRNLEIVCSR